MRKNTGSVSNPLNDEAHFNLVDSELVPVREVRAAVTMVGGTSLAIYENGVSQELFRMTQGEGAYALVKRLTQSHAFVDILSGTSAGGINTIFLGAALTMDREMEPTRDAWITLGGIDDLLQDAKKGEVKALLRGNGYYVDELIRAFEQISRARYNGTPAEPRTQRLRSGRHDEWHYSDLDLFVTGTYYQGRPQAFFDARNRPIFTEDYRGIFHLKHRPRREESHFHPGMKEPHEPQTSGRDSDGQAIASPWAGLPRPPVTGSGLATPWSEERRGLVC